MDDIVVWDDDPVVGLAVGEAEEGAAAERDPRKQGGELMRLHAHACAPPRAAHGA
jgi:hypothetical protein